MSGGWLRSSLKTQYPNAGAPREGQGEMTFLILILWQAVDYTHILHHAYIQKLGAVRERLPEGSASATRSGRRQPSKCCSYVLSKAGHTPAESVRDSPIMQSSL